MAYLDTKVAHYYRERYLNFRHNHPASKRRLGVIAEVLKLAPRSVLFSVDSSFSYGCVILFGFLGACGVRSLLAAPGGGERGVCALFLCISSRAVLVVSS